MAIEQVKSAEERQESQTRREYMKIVKKHPARMARFYNDACESFSNNATFTLFMNFIIKQCCDEWGFDSAIATSDEFRRSLNAYYFAKSAARGETQPKGLIPMLGGYCITVPDGEDEEGEPQFTTRIDQIRNKLERERRILTACQVEGSEGHQAIIDRFVAKAVEDPGGRSAEVRAQMWINAQDQMLQGPEQKVGMLTHLIKEAGLTSNHYYRPDRDRSDGLTMSDKQLDNNMEALDADFDLSDLSQFE